LPRSRASPASPGVTRQMATTTPAPNDQAAGLVGRMQAAADVVERGAVGGERIRLLVDVAKGDVSGADRVDELVALARDAGVANRAARVVPDNEAMSGPRIKSGAGFRRKTLQRYPAAGGHAHARRLTGDADHALVPYS
jgi:hypothetical protein